jgi:mono/diheme cytochrome c family protein
MRAKNAKKAGVVALAAMLAACTAHENVASTNAPDNHAAHHPAATPLPAGAPRPTGASIAAMSDQYAHPRPGPVPAAGASAWVAPAPPPAFEISTPLPPADPPAPPPAAVANRQPAAPPAPAASSPAPARPAAAPAAPSPATNVDIAKGRQLFSQYGCGGCHVLADGGGSGGIGPSLDNNLRLTRDYVAGAISEGRGAMPAFRDQMTAGEIATLAAYVVQAARK